MTPAFQAWDPMELTFQGPRSGNPYLEVRLSAKFQGPSGSVEVPGFYDGEGVYKVRFLPAAPGSYRWSTQSNTPELNGREGSFEVGPARPGRHGPVRAEGVRLLHADGTPHLSFGTTCYAWPHQEPNMREQTLRTLAASPFNKIRFCVFPKSFRYNENEPPLYPFEGKPMRDWDWNRPNYAFLRHFEECVRKLDELGIQADIILLHPYDRWGFAKMPRDAEARFLRHVVARLAAFPNVWWSMANEYDLMPDRDEAYWDGLFQLVRDADPFGHLRSVHNCGRWYDHAKPWVTHLSVQSGDVAAGRDLRKKFGKPVVFDEVCYEGDIEEIWGNISAREMVHRFWLGTVCGAYVGHGETYRHPKDLLWWAKGGELRGESPKRIAFLRRVVEETAPTGLTPMEDDWMYFHRGARSENGNVLIYFGPHQPSCWRMPKGGPWKVEWIDPWEITVREIAKGAEEGEVVELPSARPYMALRLTRG